MVDFIHILIGMKYTFMKNNASSAPSVWYYEYEYIIIGGVGDLLGMMLSLNKGTNIGFIFVNFVMIFVLDRENGNILGIMV